MISCQGLYRVVILLGFIAMSGIPCFSGQSPVASEDDFLLKTLWSNYQSLPQKHDIKVGLALGGGGARGLAHIGVLKVFDEEGIPVDCLAGTSVGALIGALYAAGVSPEHMEHMSQEIGWSSLTNYSRFSFLRLLITERRLSTKNMENYLRKFIGDTRFDQLKIPFVCAATDLQTGEKVVFSEGPVAPAATASATIPGIFDPVEFRHRYLVDGGLVSNIPTELVAAMGAKVIIAVAVTADFSRFHPHSIFETLNQAIYIEGETLSQTELARADIIIHPALGDISSTDLTRSAECIDAGVLAARRAVPSIQEYLVDRNLDLILHHHV